MAYRDLGRFNAREIKRGRTALRGPREAWDGPPTGRRTLPGSWAVEDFRRLLLDFPDSADGLVVGARRALGVTSKPTEGLVPPAPTQPDPDPFSPLRSVLVMLELIRRSGGFTGT